MKDDMKALDDADASPDKTRLQQNKRLIPLFICVIIGLIISLYLELYLFVIIILLVGATLLVDRPQRNEKHWQKWENYKGVLTCTRSGIGLLTPPRYLPKNS